MSSDPAQVEEPSDPVPHATAPDGAAADGSTSARRGEAERRRRRGLVFGEVLPEGTSDERSDGWSEPDQAGDGSEEWLRRQVPPHHG